MTLEYFDRPDDEANVYRCHCGGWTVDCDAATYHQVDTGHRMAWGPQDASEAWWITIGRMKPREQRRIKE